MESTQIHTQAPAWVNVIPLLLIITIMEVLMYRLARRKGKSFSVYCILGLIPLVNFIAVILLASRTDAAVLDELNELKAEIKLLKSNQQAGNVPPPIPPTIQ